MSGAGSGARDRVGRFARTTAFETKRRLRWGPLRLALAGAAALVALGNRVSSPADPAAAGDLAVGGVQLLWFFAFGFGVGVDRRLGLDDYWVGNLMGPGAWLAAKVAAQAAVLLLAWATLGGVALATGGRGSAALVTEVLLLPVALLPLALAIEVGVATRFAFAFALAAAGIVLAGLSAAGAEIDGLLRWLGIGGGGIDLARLATRSIGVGAAGVAAVAVLARRRWAPRPGVPARPSLRSCLDLRAAWLRFRGP